MTHKLIKDVDEETWRKFVAYCKIKGIKVGDKLDRILKEFLRKNFDEIFKKKKR